MRRAAKVDANQGAIVAALEKVGCTVLDLSRVGRGAPDICVGLRGKNVLMEIKNPEARGKLNEKQVQWHQKWAGQVLTVTSPEDALGQLDLTGKDGLIG
jgi:hypothetical protein